MRIKVDNNKRFSEIIKCHTRTDLASSLRLSLYTEVERTLNGSEDESICSASARRLFLSKVAHSWSHSSLRNIQTYTESLYTVTLGYD